MLAPAELTNPKKSRLRDALWSGLCRSQLSSRWLAVLAGWLGCRQATLCDAQPAILKLSQAGRAGTGSNPTPTAQRSDAPTQQRPHLGTHSRARRHALDAAAIRASTPPLALSLSARDPRCLQLNPVPSTPPRPSRPRPPSSNPLRCSAVIPQSTFSPHNQPRIRIPAAARYPHPLPAFELPYRTQLTRFHLVTLRRLALTT